MVESFTQTTHVSWFSRIKGAVIGIPIGLLLLVVAVVLLWWNEGRAVTTAKSLKEGESLVVSLTELKPNAENDGKLVHLTGEATTTEEVADPVFGIHDTAICLQRKVEMFQWIEDESTRTRKKVGGGEERITEYTYEKAWREDRVNSDSFEHQQGHRNPSTMPYVSDAWYAQHVSLGDFQLNTAQVRRIDRQTPVRIDDARIATLQPAIRSQVLTKNGGLYIPADGVPSPSPAAQPPAAEATAEATGLAESTGAPQVGDVRIAFTAVYPLEISVIAKQVKQTFKPYQTQAGDALDMLEEGTHSADEMIAEAAANNVRLTWILRVVGFIVTCVGLGLVFGPLSVLADFIPLLGNLTRTVTGFVAVVLAIPISLGTIGMSWLFYRPLLGGILLGAAFAVIAAVIFLLRARQAPALTHDSGPDEIIDVG